MKIINPIDSLIKRLDEYIEYAEALKRFADVAFYKEIQDELMKHYKIEGTAKAWELRELGADERYASEALPESFLY